MLKCIKLYNDPIMYHSVEKCGTECYRYCGLDESHNISEKINLNTLNNNVFINYYDAGRYGNYIYGILYTVILLCELEHNIIGTRYETIVNNIISNTSKSKLYSVQNCKIKSDMQSNVKDKYYFKSIGVDSFNYFTCHHFDDDPMGKNYKVSVENIIFLFDNDKLCFYFDKNAIIDLLNYGSKISIDDIINFVYTNIIKSKNIINDNGNDLLILLNKHKTTENEHDLKSSIKNNLLKCYTGNNIIFFNLSANAYGLFHTDPLANNPELKINIKKIILPDTKGIVNRLYSKYENKYAAKYNLAVTHFRGGDFEKYNNKDFKILHPYSYLKSIDSLIKKIGNNKKILLLCCFHSKDIMFHAYIAIIKEFYGNVVDIKTENDMIAEFEEVSDVFSNETKHVLFMSLFPNIITSNSTYSIFSAQMNIVNNSIIFVNKPYGCIECGMNFKGINWDVKYGLFCLSIDKINNEKIEYYIVNTNDSVINPESVTSYESLFYDDNTENYIEFDKLLTLKSYSNKKIIEISNNVSYMNNNSIIYKLDEKYYEFIIDSISYENSDEITYVTVASSFKQIDFIQLKNEIMGNINSDAQNGGYYKKYVKYHNKIKKIFAR
jgi:hypothetical protein